MKTISLLTLIIFIIGHTNAQKISDYLYSYSVNYKISYKINTSQKEPKEDYYSLLANEKQSIYRPTGEMIFDTIQLTKEFKNKTQEEQIALYLKYGSDVNEVITTTLNSKTITHSYKVSDLSPCYTEIIDHKWKLLSETKEINGVTCKKATCTLFGRTWTAWYSTQHPVPFGPYKFFGLPGLIINIEDNTNSYKFEVMRITRRPKFFPIEVFDNVFKTTKEKTIKIYENGRYALSSSLANAEFDPELKRKMEENKKKLKEYENNPIELKPFEYN